jgi:PAS domain S-box-containing protein
MNSQTDVDKGVLEDTLKTLMIKKGESVLDAIAELIVLQDAEMRVVWANQAAGASVGVPVKELIGRHCYEIWHGREKPCEACPVRNTLDTGEPQEREMKSTDGREWFIKGYPVRDSEGQITGAIEITMDITDRKRAELDLIESEEHFRQLISQSLQGIAIIQDMRIAFANEALGKMVGLPVEQLMAVGPKEVEAFVHPEDREMVWGRYRSRLAGEEVPEQYEFRVLKGDGSVGWLEMHSRRIDFKGRPAIQCVFIDMTARKEADRARRESEEKYVKLFQNSNDAIFLHDLEGNIVDTNTKAQQMFGYSRSDFVSVSIPSLHPPEELEKSKRAFEAIAQDGFVNFDIKFMTRDGDVFPAEVSASMFEIQGKQFIQGIVRDITERKRAEAALRQSEEQHRSLVENINETIFTLDTQGRFTYISPVMERVLGYEPAEISGRPFNCFVHPDDAPGFLVKLEKSLSGDIQTHELRVLAKDGEPHFVRVSCRPLLEDERLIGLTGIMADITESKLAKAVLREKEQMYETLVRTTTDAVTVTDLSGTITEVSNRAVQLLGHDKPEDLIGRSAFETIASGDHQIALNNMKKTLKEGFIRRAVYSFIRKDGSQFIGELDAAVIKDASDNPKGFIATTKDITELRRAEKALRRSEQRFRDIAEHASEWIWEVDSEGMYTYSSPVIKRILGYEPEEILGKHFYDLYAPDEREKHKEEVFEVFARKQPFRGYIHRNLHKDGREVWLSTSGVPIIDDDGRLTGYRGADTDITEAHQSG